MDPRLIPYVRGKAEKGDLPDMGGQAPLQLVAYAHAFTAQDVRPEGRTALIAVIPSHSGMADERVDEMGRGLVAILEAAGATIYGRSADGDLWLCSHLCREAREAFLAVRPDILELPVSAIFPNLRMLRLNGQGFHCDVMHFLKSLRYKFISEHLHAAFACWGAPRFRASDYASVGASLAELETGQLWKLQDVLVLSRGGTDRHRRQVLREVEDGGAGREAEMGVDLLGLDAILVRRSDLVRQRLDR